MIEDCIGRCCDDVVGIDISVVVEDCSNLLVCCDEIGCVDIDGGGVVCYCLDVGYDLVVGCVELIVCYCVCVV